MAGMLSLLDVLPRHELVNVGDGQELTVFGVSGGDIGRILARYPNAFDQMAQAGNQPTIMDSGLLGALLAASQRNGHHESLLDEEAEARARSLPVTDQMAMLLAMGRCTFPDGVGPFLESLVSISSKTSEAMEVVVRVASKDQDTALQRTLKRSGSPVTPPSGT